MCASKRRTTAVIVAVLAGTGCEPGAVRLDAQPDAGHIATYRVEVDADAVTALAARLPRRTASRSLFRTRHEVLAAETSGRRVEVEVTEAGAPAATYVVGLDRAGQLTRVASIEGLPAEALGDLGLAEIFPRAVAAPPDRALAPGDRWSIDEPVSVAGTVPSRLRGEGRLVRLGVEDGRQTATVETSYRLPVRRNEVDTGGRLRLDGEQHTTATVTYDLADGVVRAARARTVATYRIALFPPIGTAGEPVPGTLELTIRSSTRRRG